jgi:hypothetical protein
MWWFASNREFWITSLVPTVILVALLWSAARADDRGTSSRAVVAVLLVLALFIVAGLPVSIKGNVRERAAAEIVQAFRADTRRGDLLVTPGSELETYARLYFPHGELQVVSLERFVEKESRDGGESRLAYETRALLLTALSEERRAFADASLFDGSYARRGALRDLDPALTKKILSEYLRFDPVVKDGFTLFYIVQPIDSGIVRGRLKDSGIPSGGRQVY